MSLHLITGYGGSEHITAADDGSFNAAFFGTGSFVLNRGNKFSASITSNNNVRILDGDLMMQGRHVRLSGNHEDITIENGTLDMYRNDLIVARYTKNAASGIENCSLAVIKGTSGSTAVDPAYTSGNIFNGDILNEMPMYRVKLNGFILESIEPMFEVRQEFATKDDTDELEDRVEELESDSHTHSNKTVLDGINASDVAAWEAETERILVATNVVVPASSFVDDETYSDYAKKAVVSISGVTSNHIPNVIFDVAEASIFAPVALTGSGTITLYASEVPESDVTIPTIYFVKAVIS